jgi:hypothetical protein
MGDASFYLKNHSTFTVNEIWEKYNIKVYFCFKKWYDFHNNRYMPEIYERRDHGK